MDKYIVKDWAGNIMNWGEFTDEDYASESITNHVLAEMSSEGYGNQWLDKDTDKLTKEDLEEEKLFNEYHGEYYIEPVNNEDTCEQCGKSLDDDLMALSTTHQVCRKCVKLNHKRAMYE